MDRPIDITPILLKSYSLCIHKTSNRESYFAEVTDLMCAQPQFI